MPDQSILNHAAQVLADISADQRADTALRYRRAARLDDLLDVTVRVAEAGRASMRLSQQAWRGGELLAEGEIRIGCVAAQDATSAGFRPCRIPAAILEKIQ